MLRAPESDCEHPDGAQLVPANAGDVLAAYCPLCGAVLGVGPRTQLCDDLNL